MHRTHQPLLPLAAILTALAGLAVAPGRAAADQRSYTFTYQPITAPKGGLELELHSTFFDPPGGSARGRGWQHQLEAEYGITDRWDAAVYAVFERPYGGDAELEALKLESRYRLTEPGVSPLDAVVYLEVERVLPGSGATAIEEKLIVGKDLGRLNLALNLIAEQEFVGGETELVWGWSSGASWEFSPAFRLGAECFGEVKKVEAPSGDSRSVEAFAGPSVGVSLPLSGGPLHGAWAAITAGFGLTRESDDLRIRAILAFQF